MRDWTVAQHFAIWIGHPEENLGWDLVAMAREAAVVRALLETRSAASLPREVREEALGIVGVISVSGPRYRIEALGEVLYTRAGSFQVSAEGQLVTPDGYVVSKSVPTLERVVARLRARFAAGVLALSIFTPAIMAAQNAERVDTAVGSRIRDEGFNRSQVMETASRLTDVYGPRLTNSPQEPTRTTSCWSATTRPTARRATGTGPCARCLPDYRHGPLASWQAGPAVRPACCFVDAFPS